MGGILDAIANYNPTGFALANQQKEAGVRDTEAQIAQRQAEVRQAAEVTREKQLENEARTRSLKDMNAFADSLSRNGGDPTRALQDPTFHKNVSGAGFMSIGNTVLGNQKTAAETAKQLAEAAKVGGETADIENKYFGNLAAGLQGKSDPEIMAALATAGGVSPQHKEEAAQLIQHMRDKPGSGQEIVQHLLDASGIGRVVKGEQTKQALETSQAAEANARVPLIGAQAAEASALAGKNTVEAQIAKLGQTAQGLAAALTKSPEDFQNALDALPHGDAKLFDGAKTPDEVLRRAVKPVEAIKAQQDAAELAQRKAHETAEEAARKAEIGVQQGNLGIRSKEFEAQYGSGANPALVGVEPKLRTQATTAAQKATDSYQTAIKAADDIQSFIDLARGGNKAAGSNLPLVGVEAINALQGIKRINRTEVDQYQGAGSLLDKIQGRIGSLVAGQPIPADVLKDIESLHSTLRESATKAYKNRIDGINQNYRSNFQPIKGGESAPKTLSSGHKVGDTVNVKGKSFKITKVNPDDTFEGDPVK